jgi:hypothetical protein
MAMTTSVTASTGDSKDVSPQPDNESPAVTKAYLSDLRFWRRNSGKKRLPSQDFTLRPVSGDEEEGGGSVADAESTEYRVYKRRWFGLVQLTLMNIIVSWGVSTYISLHQTHHLRSPLSSILISSRPHTCIHI